MRNSTSHIEQMKMVGFEVTALGTCGTGDGVIIQGILRELSPVPTVMVQRGNGFEQPFSVNSSSLKLVNQSNYSEIAEDYFSKLIIVGSKLMYKKSINDYIIVEGFKENIIGTIIPKK